MKSLVLLFFDKKCLSGGFFLFSGAVISSFCPEAPFFIPQILPDFEHTGKGEEEFLLFFFTPELVKVKMYAIL